MIDKTTDYAIRKNTLASLRKIVRKEFGKKCKERSPLCCVCVAWQCVEDLEELLAN